MRSGERIFIKAALALLGSCAFAAPGFAATCTVSTTSVAFGAYNPLLTTPHDQTGTITMSCDGAAEAFIRISAGSSGNIAARRMTSGANILNYNLYKNAARSSIWGTNSTQQLATGVVSAPGRTFTVYGRIPALQNVRAGNYGDTLTVTVEY